MAVNHPGTAQGVPGKSTGLYHKRNGGVIKYPKHFLPESVSVMDFSELRDVELREVWPNEANDFTPWLSENLQRLSRVIGISIEPDDSQVAVDGSSADILAYFPANGSRVVIENQLENTDNDHLGRIMNHLARLEAQTAIWVAREFQPSHLAAIRWLNINTAEDYAFFGVRVRAVRVGDFPAPVAPVFEVLEQPHDWDRTVLALNHAVQKGAGRNDRLNRLRRKRNDFWHSYAERHPADIELDTDHNHSNVYHSVGGVLVSQYLAQRRVGIYLVEKSRSYDGEALRLMSTLRERLQLNLGDSSEALTIDTNDRDNWPDMIDWLHEKLNDYRRVIERYSTGTVDEVPEYEPAEFE